MRKSTLITILFVSISNYLFAQWTTNGTNIYNSNTGNVGIGTTAPGNLFVVSGTTASPLTVVRTTAASNISMEFKNSTGSWFAGQGSNGNFGIATNNNIGVGAPFNITTAGNIGIGTITPGNLLEVSGAIPSPLTITRTTASNISMEFKNSTGSWFAGQTSTGNFGIATNNNIGVGAPFNITTAGNIGIGTTTPSGRLQVMGTVNSTVTGAGGDNNNFLFSNPNAANTSNDPRGGIWLDNDGRFKLRSVTGYGFAFRSTADTFDILNINDNGLSIGTQTMPSGYKLAVNGSAIATAIFVKLYSEWPDYVFKPAYQLRPLTEVKAYIVQNQRLPEIPSADEIAKEGLNLGEMNKLLMKKVEELTLYLIEKDQIISEQQKKLSDQELINKTSEERLKRLERLLPPLKTNQ
jgi:hypothetical protein